ncbi:hypothetical protein KY290_024771 [Solanum tuberosum]|uniref:Uncharacterized protein n=1 Tax=Solanum tuberosum TaxID=4113 RepID=A0ABQ7URL2_SOLTU|nr:hypothetical protein KY284_023627 [Solanum tuberosum]KAH0754501.1 hypothetical protein KY290_024771 [Solanum tuberosum]
MAVKGSEVQFGAGERGWSSKNKKWGGEFRRRTKRGGVSNKKNEVVQRWLKAARGGGVWGRRNGGVASS